MHRFEQEKIVEAKRKEYFLWLWRKEYRSSSNLADRKGRED